MTKTIGPDFEPLAKQWIDGILQAVLPQLQPQQVWINRFTSSRQVVAEGLLARRLEDLESRNSSSGGHENSPMSTLGKEFASNVRISQTRDTSRVITMEPFVKLNATITRLETQV